MIRCNEERRRARARTWRYHQAQRRNRARRQAARVSRGYVPKLKPLPPGPLDCVPAGRFDEPLPREVLAVSVEDGEVTELVLGDANPPLPEGVHQVSNTRLATKVRDEFEVAHAACPMLLMTHKSVIAEASAPFLPPPGARATPWSDPLVQRTLTLRDVTGVGFLAVTTSAPGAAAKPRPATAAAAAEAEGSGQPAAEEGASSSSSSSGADRGAGCPYRSGGHGSGGHGNGGGVERGGSGSGAVASGTGASGTGGSDGRGSAGPGGRGGQQHTLPFNLQDSTLELQAVCYEVVDPAARKRVRGLYRQLRRAENGMTEPAKRFGRDHEFRIQGRALKEFDRSAFGDGYKCMRRDDAHGQPPGHVRKLVTELAEAVYDNVVQHVGVFGKAREASLTNRGHNHTVLGRSFCSLVAATKDACIRFHVDSTDGPLSIILWFHSGTGRVQGGWFCIPGLGLRFVPGNMTVLVMRANKLLHATAASETSGTAHRRGSSHFVRRPDAKLIAQLAAGARHVEAAAVQEALKGLLEGEEGQGQGGGEQEAQGQGHAAAPLAVPAVVGRVTRSMAKAAAAAPPAAVAPPAAAGGRVTRSMARAAAAGPTRPRSAAVEPMAAARAAGEGAAQRFPLSPQPLASHATLAELQAVVDKALAEAARMDVACGATRPHVERVEAFTAALRGRVRQLGQGAGARALRADRRVYRAVARVFKQVKVKHARKCRGGRKPPPKAARQGKAEGAERAEAPAAGDALEQ